MTDQNENSNESKKKEEKEKKKLIEISDEMKRAYIDYAMSVIVARALPAVEDGLKPVQRRILYAMNLMGLQHSKPTRKTARIVGEVLGKLHPHGDVAVYDALVRIAQDFSMRYPLIQGQGNFGSIDGDPPAAMRYTEARLAQLSNELLSDIDKGTVKFIPNFDNSLQEPVVLPAKLPNLLINGSTGIAVGMTTNIPPHNLTNVIDSVLAYITKPDIAIEKLAAKIQGPDFPTGGYIIKQGIDELYKTGRAHLTVRGKAGVEKSKKRERIIISEIPYQVNKAELVTSIAKLIKEKRLPDVADLRDESAKGKIRIVIELRKGTSPQFTLNRIYQYTNLQTRFDAIMLALVAGQPRVLNLKDIIKCYVDHRKAVVLRRTKFELRKASERKHITEGLLIALKDLDGLISLIKKSANTTIALTALQQRLKLSKKQAQAILETRLQRLTSLEQNKLKEEDTDLKKRIAELQKIIGSEKEILNIIRTELLEVRRKYGDSRRTYILERVSELTEKDLVAKKDVVITITSKSYVKRMPLKTYKEQQRGGKGVIGADLATGDFVKQLIVCTTHDYLLFFTSKGKVYWLKAYQIPEVTRYGKGKAIINLLNISDEITAVLSVRQFNNFLIMATEQGAIKKIKLEAFSRPRKTGLNAIKLNGDKLIEVSVIKGNEELMLATQTGIANRFNASEIREMSKAAHGVTGIKLSEGDRVIGLEVLPADAKEREAASILTVTEKGYGKRTKIAEYRITRRASKGITNIKTSERNGPVIGVEIVKGEDSVIVTTAKGMVIRVPIKTIRDMGRATQGVRIIRLQPADSATSLVKVAKEVE